MACMAWKPLVIKNIYSLFLVLLFLASHQVSHAQEASLAGDVVFAIDESGSMGDDIAEVRNNVGLIANSLSQSIDARYGLVGFGAFANHQPGLPNGAPHIHRALTDLAGFTAGLGELDAFDSFEPGLSATILGFSGTMNFRPQAAACMVLITDEDADDPQSLTAAVQAARGRNASWFGIVAPRFGNTAATYGPGAGSLAAETGGQVFSIASFRADPQPVLTAILETCARTVLTRNPLTIAGPPGDNPGVPFSFEPVNLVTGNYVFQAQDFSLPGRGLPTQIVRTYNSLDSATGSALGAGWRLDLHMSVTQTPGGDAVVTTEGGRRDVYIHSPDGTFTAPPGVYAQLTQESGAGFTLRRKDQTLLTFSTEGRLITIADRNGNTQHLAYDSTGRLSQLTDTVGRVFAFAYDADNRLSGITDPIGRTFAYGYDADGRLATATDPQGNTTAYTYDENSQLATITNPLNHTLVTSVYDAGRVVEQADARGNRTLFAYDPANSITRVTDPLGHTTTYRYNDRSRLIEETDPLGQTVRYEYDENNNRTQITDKNNNVTKFTYDEQGNVTSKTDALGQVTTIEYDALNNPTRRVDALNNVTSYGYDANSNLIEITDALGNVSRIAYDASGQPLTLTDARGSATRNTFDTQGNLTEVQDALGNKTTFAYDGVGRRTSVTDANGKTAAFTYDNNDNLLSITDPLGNNTTYAYDANNNRTGITDPRGNQTVFAYDANDLLAEVTDPLGNSTLYAYDEANNRVSVTDARGNVTRYDYDEANRLTRVIDALGKTTNLALDPAGNLLSQNNPLGHTTSFTYDALNRLVTAADPLGNATQNSYDALGRVTETQDANGRITRYSYDALGRLVQVTDPAGGTAAYGYDAVGNRTAIADPNGNTTTYLFDALNRLAEKRDPLGNRYAYGYDAVGNRTQLTDAKGQAIRYQYDGNNRLIEILYPGTKREKGWGGNDSRVRPGPKVTFAYDAAGNRTRMEDTLGISTYDYDALNRLASYTDPFRNRVGNEYDPAGNRQALIYPNGKQVNYGYDALNRMATVTDWLGGTTTYAYDDAGNLIGSVQPNGTTVAYAYDPAERLTQLVNANQNGSVLTSYDLTLDPVGNRTAIDKVEPLKPLFQRKDDTYTYDSDNRLLALDNRPVKHDANGNLIFKPLAQSPRTRWEGPRDSYDKDDLLRQFRNWFGRHDKDKNHRNEHDRVSGVTYKYDFEDRLTQVDGPSFARYAYDGVGNRLVKDSDAGTTRYTLDVTGPLSNVLVESDGRGEPKAYYVHGLGLISRISKNQVRYYHYDPIGSTVKLTDAQGKVTDSYAYGPFGEVLNAKGKTDNPFLYVGRFGVMEEGNGLMFMRARYYDAGTGRLISQDAKSVKDRDGQSLNRYTYAVNNPILLIDASGFSPAEAVREGLFSAGSSDYYHDEMLAYDEQAQILEDILFRIGKASASLLSDAQNWKIVWDKRGYWRRAPRVGEAGKLADMLDVFSAGQDVYSILSSAHSALAERGYSLGDVGDAVLNLPSIVRFARDNPDALIEASMEGITSATAFTINHIADWGTLGAYDEVVSGQNIQDWVERPGELLGGRWYNKCSGSWCSFGLF